jgi:hypothetical protein
MQTHVFCPLTNPPSLSLGILYVGVVDAPMCPESEMMRLIAKKVGRGSCHHKYHILLSHYTILLSPSSSSTSSYSSRFLPGEEREEDYLLKGH